MTHENVEVMRAYFAAWDAGNMSTFFELHGPDVIGRGLEDWPEPGPFVGREAVMRQWEQMRATFDTYETELVGDFIGVGDRVVVRYTWRGVGSGPESNIEITGVFTVRKRRVVYMEFFWDHEEALESLGLRE
jgi:ketosteroid isomerase-like protein